MPVRHIPSAQKPFVVSSVLMHSYLTFNEGRSKKYKLFAGFMTF
jgi:hypothetical protein